MPFGRQDATHPGFVAKDQRYDCAQCIRNHGKDNDFPDLAPGNALAWALYQQVEDQVRIGMDVVGLDYAVLPAVFDLYSIPQEDRRDLFEKIVILNRANQEHRSRQRALEQSKKAAEQHNRVANG